MTVSTPRNFTTSLATLILARRWDTEVTCLEQGDRTYLLATKNGKSICFLVCVRHHTTDSLSQTVSAEQQETLQRLAQTAHAEPGYAIMGIESNLEKAHLCFITEAAIRNIIDEYEHSELKNRPFAESDDKKEDGKRLLRITYSPRTIDTLRSERRCNYVELSLKIGSQSAQLADPTI